MTHHDLENGQASSCLIKSSHSSCGNTRTSLTDWKQVLHLIMSRAIRSCQNVFAIDKNRREGKSQQGYITKKAIFRLGSDLFMGASPTRTPRRRATSTSICSSDQKLWPEIPELGSIVTWRCWESPHFSIHKYLSYIYTTKWMLAFKCHLMRCHWDVPFFYTWTHGWFKNALGSPSTITFWIKPHVESRQWWFGPTSDLYGWNQNTHLFWTFCENTLLSAHNHYCCFALSETFGQWPLALCKSSHASGMAKKKTDLDGLIDFRGLEHLQG